MSDDVQTAVTILWDYMQLKQPVEAADVMVVLGSRDDRVAKHAAELLKHGMALSCVVTGGAAHQNDMLRTTWPEASEAEHFVNVMKTAGVSGSQVIVEDQATNTGENVLYSHRVLKDAGISTRSLLIVTKPYMERRALATFESQWPDKAAAMRVTSQAGSIAAYCNHQETYDDVVNIMVGDFQRILEYPKLGYQTEQPNTAQPSRAFDTLVKAGFTKHLL